MARELQAQHVTGATLYAVLLNASAEPWNGTTFDTTPTAGEWANYDIAMTEDSTLGYYVATFPASQSAGVYSYRVHKQLAGAPATTDPVVWTGDGQWAGDSWTVLGDPAGASIAADLAAIEAQTDDIGAAGAGLTALGDTRLANLDATVSTRATAASIAALNNLSSAQAQTAAAAALTAYDPPTHAELTSALAALNDLSVADIIAGISEGSLDLQEILRILLAFAAGKTAGGATTSIAFRNQADTLDRIVMTVDADGDRSATVVDGS